MLRNAILPSFVDRNLTTIAIAQIIVLGLIALPLAGCGADGPDGPAISSLSTPSDAPSGKDAQPDSNVAATGSPDGEAPTAASPEHEAAEHATAHAAEDFDPATIAEPVEGDEDPTISVTSTPTGATAQLTWDASQIPMCPITMSIMESNHPESLVHVPMRQVNRSRLHQQ